MIFFLFESNGEWRYNGFTILEPTCGIIGVPFIVARENVGVDGSFEGLTVIILLISECIDGHNRSFLEGDFDGSEEGVVGINLLEGAFDEF